MVIALVGVPLVATYTAIVDWVFRRKVKLDEHAYGRAISIVAVELGMLATDPAQRCTDVQVWMRGFVTVRAVTVIVCAA